MTNIFIQIRNSFEKKAFEELLNQSDFNICLHPHPDTITLSDEPLLMKEGKFLLLSTISKPFCASDILTALKTLSQKNHIMINEYSLNYLERNLVNLKTNQQFKLTEKETEVLKYLFLNEREVEKDELLKTVWSYHESVETHTLETHIYRLRQKIEKDPSSPVFILNGIKGYLINRKPL